MTKGLFTLRQYNAMHLFYTVIIHEYMAGVYTEVINCMQFFNIKHSLILMQCNAIFVGGETCDWLALWMCIEFIFAEYALIIMHWQHCNWKIACNNHLSVNSPKKLQKKMELYCITSVWMGLKEDLNPIGPTFMLLLVSTCL